MKKLRKYILVFLGTILGLYFLVLLSACSFQERLIFHPLQLDTSCHYALPPNAREVKLRAKDGTKISSIFFNENSQNVVLFFHGNGGDLDSWQHFSKNITSKQTSFYIIDYRGYGKNRGKITEKGIYQDAQAAYDYLLTQGFTEDHIIVYGRSIGTGVATHLAATNSPGKLILEASYKSLTVLAKEKAPYLLPGLILRYRFNSLENMKNIHCPILFIHGKQDYFITCDHSITLYNAYKGEKQLLLIEGAGHNNTNTFKEYHDAVKAFITPAAKDSIQH